MQGVKQSSAILQDVGYCPKYYESSVSKVECYVCGKGIQDGHSISAKTLPTGVVLFCDIHYPLQ